MKETTTADKGGIHASAYPDNVLRALLGTTMILVLGFNPYACPVSRFYGTASQFYHFMR